jgi:hypothetical protein
MLISETVTVRTYNRDGWLSAEDLQDLRYATGQRLGPPPAASLAHSHDGQLSSAQMQIYSRDLFQFTREAGPWASAVGMLIAALAIALALLGIIALTGRPL